MGRLGRTKRTGEDESNRLCGGSNKLGQNDGPHNGEWSINTD